MATETIPAKIITICDFCGVRSDEADVFRTGAELVVRQPWTGPGITKTDRQDVCDNCIRRIVVTLDALRLNRSAGGAGPRKEIATDGKDRQPLG